MKSFQFRLERVLSWRGTQLSVEEAKVEQLAGGLRTTDHAMACVVEGRAAAQASVERAATVSGADLRVLEASRLWAVREEKRLAARKVTLKLAIETQNRRVAEARLGVKLVERLKERKYDVWKADASRESDELAAESAIAQWRRLNH
ncbi:MAG: hypothetical protein ABI759_01645 [Candidatus Solibacter sp.]